MSHSRVVRSSFVLVMISAACRAGDKPATQASATEVAAPSATVPSWLLARDLEERTQSTKSAAVHDFLFTDARDASGITFTQQIVDDAGRAYKADHYDHGTGVCAADVDNDGKTDLFFVSQRGSSELWRNAGNGKFVDITTASGLRTTDAISVGCAFADVDNDGLVDLFVTTARHGNRLYKNTGNGVFADITVDAGVGYIGHSSGAVFFDYDGDGLLDLLVTNVGKYTSETKGAGGYFVGLDDAFHGHTHPDRAEASILYRNAGGGHFTDVSKQTGFDDKSWSGDATIVDVNDDGRPDIYMLNMMGENHLWLNVDGAHFRDETRTYFPKTPWGAMGAKVFDYDGDGRLDLYVTDMHSDMWTEVAPGDWLMEFSKSNPRAAPPDLFPTGTSQFVFGNALYSNRARAAAPNSAYREVSDSLGVETYWPWGPSVDDVNADGWDDVLVIGGMNFPYRYSTNALLLNENGQHFRHAEFTLGVEPRAGGRTEQTWYHVDCSATGADKGSKACTTCTAPGASEAGCHADTTAGHFTMTAARGSRSSVILDIDGDGDLDIVTNEFNAMPQVLINSLAAKHSVNRLSVRLRGTKSNRQGLGAQVTVVLPDQRRVLKVMDGKSGYLSQSDLPLYFGLGTADHAASVEVRWPTGKTQTFAGPVKAGQTIEIVEQ
jgi:hypothetical protein